MRLLNGYTLNNIRYTKKVSKSLIVKCSHQSFLNTLSDSSHTGTHSKVVSSILLTYLTYWMWWVTFSCKDTDDQMGTGSFISLHSLMSVYSGQLVLNRLCLSFIRDFKFLSPVSYFWQTSFYLTLLIIVFFHTLAGHFQTLFSASGSTGFLT